ncbi:MFS multidrug transporter [Penicillium atrosanguineum]|nr:MFS multidrug transporter [Penicillium atrosanguineum]
MSREATVHSNKNTSMEKNLQSGFEDSRLPTNHTPQEDNTVLQHMDQTEGGKPQWLQGSTLIIIMVALTIVSYLMLLDVSVVSTALPAITNEFNSLPDLGWYGAAYQLSNAALQPLSGKIYTHFTPKWTLLIYFFVFEVGSLICALATSSNMLIVGRTIAGMGNSGIPNGCVTIIAGMVPLHKRPALLGIMMGSAIVALLVVFIRIPDPLFKEPSLTVLRTLHKKLDFIGVAGFAGSVIMLLLAIQFGGIRFPWNSPTIIGLFCGSGITFLLWIAWSMKKSDKSLIPLKLMKQRPVWSSCLTYGLTMGSLFTTSYFLPVYFQGVLGATPLLSGVQLLPNIIPQLLAAVLSGILVTRIGYYIPFSLIGAVFISVGAGLISTYSPMTPLARRIGFQIILGTGYGLSLQMPLVAIQNSVQLHQLPVAVGVLMFCPQLSGALLVSFGNTIFSNSLRNLVPQYAPSVNPDIVVAAGATSLRNAVPPSTLHNVLIAYAKSVDRVYYLGAGCGVATFFSAWGMGWKNIRRTEKPELPQSPRPQEQESHELVRLAKN